MRRGQVMVEYVITMTVLVGVIAILWGLVELIKPYETFTRDVILSE